MTFSPERLISVRKSIGINKNEAARRLNMSAMGYGRYESGARVPSFQTICFIAQVFGTSAEYLCNETDSPECVDFVINKSSEPDLYSIVETLKNSDEDFIKRVLTYAKANSDSKL